MEVNFTCGCRVSLNIWEQCPVHKAAPEMYKALEEIEERGRGARRNSMTAWMGDKARGIIARIAATEGGSA